MLNADVRDFKTYFDTFMSLNFRSYYNFEDFENFMNDPFFRTIYVVVLIFILIKVTQFSLITATVMYLYRKALSLEKNDIVTPQQKLMMRSLNQMKEELDQIVISER